MFQGTIPPELRSIVAEHARTWPDGDVYVGCSGNLTIERTLAGMAGRSFRLHSNDVNPYSCALGWHYSGAPVPFSLAEDSRDELGWLEPYLDDGIGTVATLMLGTGFLHFVGKPGRYHRRMVAGYRAQFDQLHATTVNTLSEARFRLSSFTAGDFRDYLDQVPESSPLASFPPFWAAGYDKMFQGITDHFTWPAPDYAEITDEDKHDIVARIVDKPYWLLGFHVELEELADYRVGYVQTSPRGMPIWVYAKPGTTRWVGPHQPTEPVRMPRLNPATDLGDDLTLHPISHGQFNTLRSLYLNRAITPGQAPVCCAVSSGGRILGAFSYLPPKYGFDAYLNSDFAVAPTSYKRLSKLVVMAALSREAQQLVQRMLSRRITGWVTTAFTNNPTSGKYGRGIPGVSLRSRKPCDDGVHEYMLNYGGPLGNWTLDEALEMFHAKHGKVRT